MQTPSHKIVLPASGSGEELDLATTLDMIQEVSVTKLLSSGGQGSTRFSILCSTSVGDTMIYKGGIKTK